MPTPSGWSAIILSAATFVLGRAYNLQELVFFGSLGIVLLAGSLLSVWLFSPRSKFERQISARVVGAGSTVKVRLKLVSPRWWPLTLPLSGVDHVTEHLPTGKTETSLFTFAAHKQDVVYDFTPSKRGVVRFSEVAMRSLDPFALARAKWKARDHNELLVLPYLENVAPPQLAMNLNSLLAESDATSRSFFRGDFHILRDYLPGDDPRHVHWKSTARTGKLVVREDEHEWEIGLSLVLDNRAGIAGDDEFERMVGAAASLVNACHRQGISLTLYYLAAAPDDDDEAIEINSPEAYFQAMLSLTHVIQHDTPNTQLEPEGKIIVLTGDAAADAAYGQASLFALCLQDRQSDGLIIGFSSQPAGSYAGLDSLWIPPADSFAAIWNEYAVRQPQLRGNPTPTN